MTTVNQKPTVLKPEYTGNISLSFDPLRIVQQTVAIPLFQEQVPGQGLEILDDQNQRLDSDDIACKVMTCCGDAVDVSAENWCKDLYAKTLVYFDPSAPLNLKDIFLNQACVKEGMPFPSSTVLYMPAVDVIPSCREFLGGLCSYEKFFGSLAAWARVDTLGFWFANQLAFDRFKDYVKQQTAALAACFTPETAQLFDDFQKSVTLRDLTESIILRNDDSDHNEPYSFARTLVSILMSYVSANVQSEFGVLPFSLGELFCPRTLVFVNVDRHANATASQVTAEWDLIRNAISGASVQMISNNKLTHLTATARNLQKMASYASANAAPNIQRSANAHLVFPNKRPNHVEMASSIRTVLKKMHTVNRSENSYRCVKMSYARPNRRDPDDFNKQGKTVSTKYYPDIHLYIDTSGSISEDDYRQTVMTCIAMARKLNVNMYFNSFSDVLSQCTKLRTKNRSMKQIYLEFQRVPKVTGGTNFANVWRYINQSPRRKRELSLMITDFEYSPPNRYIEHPRNLYYAPCAQIQWNDILYDVKRFAKSMIANEPDIRKHILM